MRLVPKNVDLQPELWRQLKVNATLSNCPLRDFLSFVISTSKPLDASDPEGMERLQEIMRTNEEARRNTPSRSRQRHQPTPEAAIAS